MQIKWVQYAQFWQNMENNKTLLKLDISDSELSDKVMESMVPFLEKAQLVDLNLAKNLLTNDGL